MKNVPVRGGVSDSARDPLCLSDPVSEICPSVRRSSEHGFDHDDGSDMSNFSCLDYDSRPAPSLAGSPFVEGGEESACAEVCDFEHRDETDSVTQETVGELSHPCFGHEGWRRFVGILVVDVFVGHLLSRFAHQPSFMIGSIGAVT